MRITPSQAIQRLTSQSTGKKRAKGTTALPLEVKQTITVADDDLIIVGNADGGILTPLNDSLPPIIGVWEEGGDELPPSLQDMLQEYADQVEWWERCGEELAQEAQSKTSMRAKAEATPRQSVPQMLTTKWSQKAPYNDMCIFDGKKCVTGCVTTAAAQVMFYWRSYQFGCEATPKYTTSTNGYVVESLPAKPLFDYANLVATPKTDAQKKAVAELMAYLGRTFRSNYTPTGTGAYTYKIADYFNANVHMGCKEIKAIWASSLGETGFEKKVYEEIINHRPVILSGHTTTGGGHAFVADGYDAAKDLYHINWGWGGSYNGWFAMSALKATSSASYAFNSSKGAVIGIKPEPLGDVNKDGIVSVTDVMHIVNTINSGKYEKIADVNYDKQVSIADVMTLVDKILGK